MAVEAKKQEGLTASTKQLISAAIVLSLVASTFSIGQPANAFWPFSKSHGERKKVKRKKRDLQGQPVGLVPGNPPALYWAAKKGNPKAAVLCLHELGLYNGVFDDLGKRMSDKGIAVYAIDLRGFGGWREKEGKESKMDLDKTTQDVKGSCEIIHKLHPDTKLFILGEAMGGALALQAAEEFPELISGIISSAPGGEHHNTVNNYVTIATSLAVGSKHGFGLGEELVDVASPKEGLKDALKEDEMVRMDVTTGEMMACQFFMYKTKKMAKEIKDTPVLIVHGEKDGESKLSGSKGVYERLGTKDKKFLLVEDGDHYTFEDINVNDKAFDSAIAFIDDHLIADSTQK
jgi:acylglycerol lipase